MNSNEMIEIDLPSLQSIQLGRSALCGNRFDVSCSLIMRSKKKHLAFMNVDLPQLSSLRNDDGYSFFYPRSVTLESNPYSILLSIIDIANLTNINLTNSFDKVQSKVISSSVAPFFIMLDVSTELAGLFPKKQQSF